MTDDSDLKLSERDYWAYTVLFGLLFVFLYWTTLCFSFRHTYELPVNSPGILVSDRWTWNFIREWLMILYCAVPLTGFFMLMTRTKTGAYAHIFILFIMFVWAATMFSFDVVQIVENNKGPHEEGFDKTSLAYDTRWCCIYGGQPGAELYCAIDTNSVSCPPMSAAPLGINSVFLFRFAINMRFWIFIIYDFFITVWTWLPRLSKWRELKNE